MVKEAPVYKQRLIGSIFYNDSVGKLRLALMVVVLVACIVTVIIPVVYVLVYACCNRGLKGFVDNVGLLLQPIILARKAAKGKVRFNEMKCRAPNRLFMGAQPDRYGGFRVLFGSNNIWWELFTCFALVFLS